MGLGFCVVVRLFVFVYRESFPRSSSIAGKLAGRQGDGDRLDRVLYMIQPE